MEEDNCHVLNKPLHQEEQYLQLIKLILEKGNKKNDRTGVGTMSIFGHTLRFDLSKEFPLLTTKKMFFKGIVEELLWIISGSTDSKELNKKGVKIWDANGSRKALDNLGFTDREEGDLGPIYGFNWRHYGTELKIYKDCHTNYSGLGIDQLEDVINQLKNNPDSRRIIINSWDPSKLKQVALPPCHVLCQFYVSDKKLSCCMYQRSCDVGLGLPFNIASYSLLVLLLCNICDLQPGEFIHQIGDTHIYLNHLDKLKQQSERKPFPLPRVHLSKKFEKIEDITSDDIILSDYQSHSKIDLEMAV